MIQVGKVTLAKGEKKLRLRPTDALEDPRMSLRSVRLYPVP
jgi:hypothetical protein